MRCPACGTPGGDDSHYCGHCGAALTPHGVSLRPDRAPHDDERGVRRLQRFIPQVVVDSLLNDPERLRGERREVTVLFVDAVDFTSLSAALDAESTFSLINDLLGLLVACVHRYDGLVDKFTGDGLMAVFGAPIAHENDTELAVRAALDMQNAAAEFAPIARAKLGSAIQIRIGVHNGPAIAGVVGTQDQAAYTVIGETVNVASRLESQAAPGHILVSERIYRNTQAAFNYRPLGAARIKGLETPLAVFDVVGERSDTLARRGLVTGGSIFLGHDRELKQLQNLTNDFLEDRQGRVILIEGEAGIGKSRLVSEWLATITIDQIALRQGRGLPYAQGVGYGVFRSLLQDAQRSPVGGERAWDAHTSPVLRPYLQRILGIKLDDEAHSTVNRLEPAQIQQLTRLALREWLLGEAADGPLLLIIDDYQWADDLSREMLEALLGLIDEAPLLFCIITRPHPEAPFAWQPPAPSGDDVPQRVLKLDIKPLRPQHSRALFGHLVDLNVLPDNIVDLILTRAEGNPFYLEEFVRMMIEKGLLHPRDGQWRLTTAAAFETVDIPTTLRGLMMARVDRLPEDLRHLLRDATVIGLQFPAALLEEIQRRQHGVVSNLLPALERLTEMGLLVKRPEVGPHVYAFRHVLTQETVYSSLLRSRRPDLHRIVAESIEHLYDDLTPHIEVLALHYDRAGVHAKTLQYTILGGDLARGRFANREAIEYYSRALQIAQHLDVDTS
ncbi:MAG: AAA family ATPase, partial [Anaerolineae bacterium]|nr:AAA family ATPase [Anaerolineae bacterium]